MAVSKQLERHLFESERNFRLLVEGITDYAIYMLDPEGHITNWNSGAERIKGYAASEIVGQGAEPATTRAGNSAAGKTFPRRRLARAQGRHALFRFRRDRSDL